MSTPDERDNIRNAMQRLLDGMPLRSEGALTVVSLATEAQVKRHLLIHRHTDLKDEFYARVRAQGHVPASEIKLREELANATSRITELRENNEELRDTTERLARVINVLTVENEQMRTELSRRADLKIARLRHGQPPATPA